MSPLHLSRLRLRRDAPAAALAPLLLPPAPDERAGAAHRLLWTLFADARDRRRDFLWRELGDGGLVPGSTSFMLLSARAPHDAHGLFHLESQEFAPALAPGDRLAFSLRANPVVTRASPGGGRSSRHDVVMDRLAAIAAEHRAGERFRLAQEAGRDWLMAQGERAGFALLGDLKVDGYEQRRIPRGPGRRSIRFSVLDLDGVMEVRDPAPFMAALARGFGKAKAFGCGLMLIRRA